MLTLPLPLPLTLTLTLILTCRRLPLDFARSAEYFKEVLAAYVLPVVRKGP